MTGSDLYQVSREALYTFGRERLEEDFGRHVRARIRARGLEPAAIAFVWARPDERDPRGLWRVAVGWISL